MSRILIFLLWIVLLAGTVTILGMFDHRIAGEAFGVKFDSPSSMVIGILLFLFALTIYATHKIKDIMAFPAKLRARDAETKRSRGVAALTRGLEAVAVGDASDASHHAKVAQKHLQDISLTRLLSAQAAQLSGDGETAKKSFTAMLEAPETEFLGLKGLYAQAIAKGDQESARDYAERAFGLRANAGWAFDSVVELCLERGAWKDAREAIAKGRKNKLINNEKADRANAALLTAAAYDADLSGDSATALSEAEAALKLAPSFAPAAVLAAGAHLTNNKTGKAATLLENAFAIDPHPALIRLYDRLYKDQEPEKRAAKLRKLASKNSDTREAALLEARAANLTDDYKNAANTLEPLIKRAADADAYALMATAMTGLHGEEVGKGWLERAAAAPRDPRPGAEGTFHVTRAGWALLVREFMEHARLAPPPLEEAGEGISEAELLLLTAPPPAPEEPVVINAEEPASGASTETPAEEVGVEEQSDEEDIESGNIGKSAINAARNVS